MTSRTDLPSRFRGCLLGGAVGDALGAPVEFMSLAQIRKRYGPEGIADMSEAYGRVGAITDDTQMTLFTAEGLLRARHREMLKGISGAQVSLVRDSYLRWLSTQGVPPRKEFRPRLEISAAIDDLGVCLGTTCQAHRLSLRQGIKRARGISTAAARSHGETEGTDAALR